MNRKSVTDTLELTFEEPPSWHEMDLAVRRYKRHIKQGVGNG